MGTVGSRFPWRRAAVARTGTPRSVAAAKAAAAVRRCAAILSVLAMAAAWFPIVALATSGPASAASAGAPLSCDGSTIYSYQRGAKPSATGSVYGLSTSTAGRASVTAHLVTTIPDGGGANGMGITKGGTAIYVVDQTPARVNAAIIHGYNTSTRTWTRYPGGSSGTRPFVAGAVDPANGIYYYVAYVKGTVTTPATGTVYGFNTRTNTRIGGTIATFNLPTGKNPNDQNGDIAFDSAGNMYVLSSDATTVAIGVVDGPIPTTGSASGVHLTDTVLTSFGDTSTYNGIAFDNAGHLYVSGTPRNVSVLTKLNPTTGAIIAGPTPLSSNAQTYLNVDLAACSLNPTLSLQKNIVGRYAPGDQFGLKITGGGISGGNTATTTGSATGVQPEPAIAGPVIAQSGTTYTLAETAASGNLLNYTTKYSCVDTANDKDLVTGTGQSFTLPFPATSRITEISPNIVCTFTNTPVTTSITLQKTAAETALSLGETLHYSFLVTNTGSVTLAPVTIAETAFTGSGTPPVASCPAGASSLAPAASVTCTATYTVTQADMDAGQVKNTATATGISPAGQPITSAPSSATVSGVRAPAITVVKSATPSSFATAGTTIDYSFLVTNTGNVTLTAVQVTDTDLPGLSAISCPHASLAPAAAETCTATYLTTQADVDAGSVTNTATAQGNPPGSITPVVSDPSTATVPVVQAPEITMVKSATPSSFATAGTTIDYSFLVTNNGNVTLAPVTIAETAFTGSGTPPVASCPAGASSLAPGASVTCTATYLTTQADVDAGSVTNTATAQGNPPGPATPVVSDPSTATVPAAQAPAITMVKSATPSSFATAGTTIDYSFLVTNNGNVTLAPVTIAETAFTGSGTPPVASCPAGASSLAPGASVTCTATYLTTQADVDAGSVTNTATAQGNPPGPATPVGSDPSTATVPAAQAPAITVVKSATPSSFATAGTTIDYSFLVTNTGNVTLSSIQVTDTDLPGLSAISCPDASLAPAGSQTCTATYLTTQADVDAGSVTNTATAQGNPPGPATPVGSDPSTATVPAAQAPAITVVKSATPSSFATAGTTIDYSFLVTNTGNVTLSSIQVTDTDLPGLSAISCPDASLAPAGSQTCTATYLTTQADVDAGSVTNTATAQGDPPGSITPVGSDPSTATVPAAQGPAITVVKSASPGSFSTAGTTLTYSFLVTNTGDVTLSSIQVTDTDLPGLSAISCPAGASSLAPGASVTCTATYVTTQADVDAGSVTNTATAQGDPPGSITPVGSDPSTATVLLRQKPTPPPIVPPKLPVTG